MKTLSRPSLALLLGALCGLPTAASALLVDDFDAPSEARVSVLAGEGEETLLDFDPSVLGGVRSVYHHNYHNPLGSLSALSVGEGQVSSTVGIGARTEVLMSYGAFTRPTGEPDVGGPRLGLDASGYDHFRWTFSGASTMLNLIVVLYTAAPLDRDDPLYYTTAALNATPASPGGPMVVDLPMLRSDPFNFAQVDGIVLLVNRANAQTQVAFNLDRFEFVSGVPEPGPAALLLAGGAVMALRLRRRSR